MKGGERYPLIIPLFITLHILPILVSRSQQRYLFPLSSSPLLSVATFLSRSTMENSCGNIQLYDIGVVGKRT